MNVLGKTDASSCEFTENTPMPIIVSKDKQNGDDNSMRLGLYKCEIAPDTLSAAIYGKRLIEERHRHRYVFNNQYFDLFTEGDMVFSGLNRDDNIVEMLELKKHPFYVACQFRPEFLSRPNRPHPLFTSFINAAIQHQL